MEIATLKAVFSIGYVVSSKKEHQYRLARMQWCKYGKIQWCK